MSTKEREKSSGKPRRSSRKPKQRDHKPDQQQRPKPDQPDEDQIGAMVASTEVASTDAPANDVAPPSELPTSAASTPLLDEVAPTDAPLIGEVVPMDAPSIGEPEPSDAPSIGAIAPTDAPSIGAVAPADDRPISIQTIAKAYGSYTEKSFQETSSFVEKLMGVRSLDKVIEVQTEFTRQAYATFVAESQKICGLYTELAKETFRSWQGFAAKATRTGRQIR
jgi:hypothetical protein